MRLPEHMLSRAEWLAGQARLLYFVPERHFYGGYLVFDLWTTISSSRRFRMWMGNALARSLGVPLTLPI